MADNSFDARSELQVGDRTFEIYRLDALQWKFDVARLPFSLKVLLENLLRNEDGVGIRKADVEALASWDHNAEPSKEIAFTPARVVLQDFTGVPCVVDLAAMRDAMADLGGDPAKINPLVPVELVIDHSVQVDVFGTRDAFRINAEKEFERNKERYAFLRWGQTAFENFKAVPPDTGIVHQVNLEYLARVVFENDGMLYPDTLVGTDSHTTMINGLGVLGWGVGGIEAEAAMLGQPMPMLIPRVVGFKLTGELREGATATDLVLTVTQRLREHGVVGQFVEFYGRGIANLPLADRATLGSMSPEFGSTCAIFPIDAETLRYLEFSGRSPEHVERVETYAKAQGLRHDADSEEATYSETLELDLGDVVPSLAGPKRPQDRVSLTEAKASFRMALDGFLPEPDECDEPLEETFPASDPTAPHYVPHVSRGEEAGAETGGVQVAERASISVPLTLADGTETDLDHGHVVIAAITSCTNTSNPSVMIGAGLLARNAVARGLHTKPWVKTSLAPGSQVVAEYLEKAGLQDDLDKLGFNLAGSMQLDLTRDPLGQGKDGPVYLKDIWPSNTEIQSFIDRTITNDLFRTRYADVFTGDKNWKEIGVTTGLAFEWDIGSTYVQNPPYFRDMQKEPKPVEDIVNARILGLFLDSITTDHISPAGNIRAASPAGKYLLERQVPVSEFNQYGTRRGNHEIMMRGTFANIRIKNQMVKDASGNVIEGGFTI